jgi:NitT/TauT family transport system substrate-binding protein
MYVSLSRGRSVLFVVIAVMVALVAGCGDDDDGDSAGATRTEVKVLLDWVPRGAHAPFFVAQEKGYFEQEGLDVSITPGKGSATTMQLVGQGRADFGFGDLPTLGTAKSKGTPVVALVATNARQPLAMCSVAEDHPLETPQSMKGARIGTDPAGSTFVFYKTLLAANNMTRDDVEEATLSQPYENFLLQGRVDVVPCYIDAELPILEANAAKEGKKISVLLGAEWGYDILGSGVLTSESMIEQNPETVQKFVNAYMKAFQWVLNNPEEAAKIVAGSSPQTQGQEATFVKQLEADMTHTFENSVTEEHGLGYMTAEQWEAVVKVLVDNKVITESPDINSLFDASFLEKAGSGGS